MRYPSRSLTISVFLPLSDKLAFPVISALSIVVCSVRQWSLCAADRTRTVALCLIVPLSGFLFIVLSVQVLIAAALICCFSRCEWGSVSCQSCHQLESGTHHPLNSQSVFSLVHKQIKLMNVSMLFHFQGVHFIFIGLQWQSKNLNKKQKKYTCFNR